MPPTLGLQFTAAYDHLAIVDYLADSQWKIHENTKTMGVSIVVEFRAVGVPVNSDVRVLICPLAVWDRGLSGA